MNRRERLRKCYFHEELDRPGVYSRTGFPADDPTYDGVKAYLAAHSEMKSGWSTRGLETVYPTESLTEPYSEDFERRRTILRTPAGELESAYLVSLKGRPGMPESYLIKTREDAEKYMSLPLPVIEGDVSSFGGALSEMGDKGIVEVSLGFNPAGFVAELIGSENFALMTITDRDALHALCDRQMRIVLNRLRFALSRGLGPFFNMAGEEYIVPPLHGPRDFDDFNVRYDRPIIEEIHNAGGRIHIHCHGSLGKVLRAFVDMGADVLHPIEPPPMGDVTAAEAKEIARGRMCIEGNIQINRMYEATPDDIRRETEQLIRDAFDDRKGLIVCPSASPYLRGMGEVGFPRFKAMVDAVLEYKG